MKRKRMMLSLGILFATIPIWASQTSIISLVGGPQYLTQNYTWGEKANRYATQETYMLDTYQLSQSWFSGEKKQWDFGYKAIVSAPFFGRHTVKDVSETVVEHSDGLNGWIPLGIDFGPFTGCAWNGKSCRFAATCGLLFSCTFWEDNSYMYTCSVACDDSLYVSLDNQSLLTLGCLGSYGFNHTTWGGSDKNFHRYTVTMYMGYASGKL